MQLKLRIRSSIWRQLQHRACLSTEMEWEEVTRMIGWLSRWCLYDRNRCSTSFAPFSLYFAFSLIGTLEAFISQGARRTGRITEQRKRKEIQEHYIDTFVSVFGRRGHERDTETEHYLIKRSFGLKILFLKLLHHSFGRSKKVGWRNDPAKQLEYIMTSLAGNESSLVINFDSLNFKWWIFNACWMVSWLRPVAPKP